MNNCGVNYFQDSQSTKFKTKLNVLCSVKYSQINFKTHVDILLYSVYMLQLKSEFSLVKCQCNEVFM